ncbi:MAG: carboxypeptidase regulatory-like domain-containing protein [Vicinamibacterales bacterium]
MIRLSKWLFAVFVIGVLWLPGVARAQSAISGVVTDASGAVLPGVTVEAASPALIEKVRSITTDAQGLYRLVDLRPGTYAVTFTLPGFRTVLRDGVELPSNFVATVNAEMSVGGLEETITVSGGAPLVDVQSTQKSAVLPRAVLDSVPTGRTYAAESALVPGVRVSESNVGGARSGSQQRLTVHGSVSADSTIEVDGISMNSWGDVQPNHNEGMWQEVTVQTASLGAEVATGGVRVNLIPRDGGNQLSGQTFFGWASQGLQSDNLNDELRQLGVTSGDKVQKLWDLGISVGGPIKRDRAWFYAGFRDVGNRNIVANSFMPDGSPGIFDQTVYNYTGRLTMQLTPRNKLTVYKDRAFKALDREFGPGVEPSRAAGGRTPVLYYTGAVKWSSPVTNRLMLEAGWGASVQSRNTGTYQPGVRQERGTPGWYAGASRVDLVLGTTRNASQGETYTIEQLFTWVASATYVTGAHNFKVGLQSRYGVNSVVTASNADLVQRYRNGVPDSVLVRNAPLYAREGMLHLNPDMGIYAQDSWRYKRLTVNPGIRYYYLHESVDPGVAPAGRFVPARSFEGIPDLLNWKNVAPRFGVAYDVTGDSRTAVKFAVSKYYASVTNQYSFYRPLTNQTDTRNWTDLNGDDIAQDNEIGPSSNSRFGLRPERRKDPDLKRPSNIEYNVGIDHQLLSNLSVSGAWYKRSFFDFSKTDNLLIAPSDYAAVQVTNPLTNEPMTIYNLNRAKLGQNDTLDTTATNRDLNRREYQGLEASFNARLPRGASMFGGWWVDKDIVVTCDGDDPNTYIFCDQSKLGMPFRHSFKLAGSAPLPWNLLLGVSLQSYAGNPLTVSWAVPANLFPGGRTQPVTVPLIPAGQKFLDRWTQVDASLRRVLTFGKHRVEASLDMFNALNSNVVLQRNQAFGATLDRPQQILQPRLIRLSAQWKF